MQGYYIYREFKASLGWLCSGFYFRSGLGSQADDSAGGHLRARRTKIPHPAVVALHRRNLEFAHDWQVIFSQATSGPG